MAGATGSIEADGELLHELAEALSLVREGVQPGGLLAAASQPVYLARVGLF